MPTEMRINPYPKIGRSVRIHRAAISSRAPTKDHHRKRNQNVKMRQIWRSVLLFVHTPARIRFCVTDPLNTGIHKSAKPESQCSRTKDGNPSKFMAPPNTAPVTITADATPLRPMMADRTLFHFPHRSRFNSLPTE